MIKAHKKQILFEQESERPTLNLDKIQYTQNTQTTPLPERPFQTGFHLSARAVKYLVEKAVCKKVIEHDFVLQILDVSEVKHQENKPSSRKAKLKLTLSDGESTVKAIVTEDVYLQFRAPQSLYFSMLHYQLDMSEIDSLGKQVLVRNSVVKVDKLVKMEINK